MSVQQQLLRYAADLLDEIERDHPGAYIDDFAIVASIEADDVGSVRVSASDDRPWAIAGLLREGIETATGGEKVDE